MSLNLEILPGIAAIYKYLYKNPNTHKNTLRKELINKGKISKDKFPRTFESLIALGKIIVDKDNVSLSPEFLKTGVLQKKGNDFSIFSPDSKKQLPIGTSVASGFSVGDFIDFAVERCNGKEEIIVLGRSSKSYQIQNIAPKPTNNKPPKAPLIPTPQIQNENLTLGRVLRISHDELVFIPNDKNIVPRHIPLLNPKEEIAAFENKLCIMNFLNQSAPILGGTIVESMGDAGNPIDEYEAIAKYIGAVMNWDNPALRAEIEKIPKKVDVDSLSLISEEEAETNHRGNTVDLRHLPFCPTDPADARDKDDAIYSTFDEDGNKVIYTAIANVPKYVDLDSLIGQIYTNAIFTFYTPNRAYNVLPSELSAGVCSLTAGENRLAFVVKTVIDKDTGKPKESRFYDALINCKREYSYEEAQEIVNSLRQEIADSFDDEDLKTHFEYKILTGEKLTPEEQVLMDFYTAQLLKFGFDQRRMLRFSSNNEYKTKFDDDQTTILDIEKIKHLPYNEVIEFFMITANEATAEFAKKNNIDTIYRVHDAPNTKKIDRASEFFDILEIDFDGNFSAEGIRNLLEIVKDTPAEELVNQFLIKMQSRAIYSDRPFNSKQNNELWLDEELEQVSHFALQSKGYSHSTAPIRRAVDYIVIYNILAHIHGTKPLSKNVILTIIENANEMQEMIDEGEKAIKAVNGVLYAENHIGEQLKGRINKLRYTSPEEGYSDEIVAVVINDEKGICAEIPISQITGRKNIDYTLSSKGCAVYDANGNIVAKLCQPLEFFIEKADRQSMNVVGKTNKELVVQSGNNRGGHNHNKSKLNNRGKNGKRVKKYNPNKSNHKGGNKTSSHKRNESTKKFDEETFGK